MTVRSNGSTVSQDLFTITTVIARLAFLNSRPAAVRQLLSRWCPGPPRSIHSHIPAPVPRPDEIEFRSPTPLGRCPSDQRAYNFKTK